MTPRRTEIGVVRSVSPSRREIRVKPLAGAEDMFEKLDLLEVRLVDETVLRCRVKEVRDETGGKIVALTPGAPRETVARMKGAVVSAAGQEAGERAYTLEDLDGMRVLDLSGGLIGRVTALYSAGGNDAMEVTKPDGTELLLPVIEQVIASVNVEHGEMIVNDIAPYAVEEE